jgi:predicted TIM-barrel fold metal-dependent hydrolase
VLLDDVAADFPDLTIETLGLDPAVASMIYKENALRVLGLR